MKKALKIIAISTGTAFVLIILFRLTGILNYFSIATPSNEPTLKKNSIVFGSNLLKPQRFDFIFYKHTGADAGTAIWIHRLCGLPGDKIQLINGELLVNDKNTSPLFETYHYYIISNNDFTRLSEQRKFREDEAFFISKDSVAINLDNTIIKDFKLAARAYFPADDNEEIYNMYKERWTADNFGPFTVPANCYFVLGDNRGNSLDSRYTGCIKKEAIVATKLGPR